jgi:hypothetical protein
MTISIDSDDFCIRVFDSVVYLKVKGIQDEEAALFFAKAVDQFLDQYPHTKLVSVCDLRDLIISSPSVGRMINQAIRKISYQLKYEYNAVLIHPKFGQTVKAYVFSFYLRDTNLKTKIFNRNENAIKWLESKDYKLGKLKDFLGE